MNEVIKTVSINLKYFRKENGLTQKEVAEYLETTQQAYSLYEKGDREVSLMYLQKLSERYKITPAYFFIDNDNIRNGEFSITYAYLDAVLYSSLELNKIMNTLDRYDSKDNKNFIGEKYESLLHILETKQREYNNYGNKLSELLNSDKLNNEIDKYFAINVKSNNKE